MRTALVLTAIMALVMVAAAADLPELPQLKQMYSETSLVEGEQSACVVAAPVLYETLATALAEAVGEACGAKPRVVDASELSDEEMARTHIIALGVFANNPVIERLYERGLVACDWSWPKTVEGSPRYVIRTVHDPWLTGRNVISIGGTSEADCKAGADRFVEMLKARGGTVGPIIEVSTADPAPTEDAVQAAIAAIRKDNSSRSMGGVAVKHANNYFFTGHEQHARMFVEAMRKLLELYIKDGDASDVRSCDHLFSQYDRIEEGPAFTPEQQRELGDILYKIAHMLTYAKTAVKPSDIPHGNNWNATGASHAGFYFSRYYPELPIGKTILDTLDIYYEPNMVNWKVNEDCPGYGNITLTGNYDWALNRPDRRFFDLDCLRMMADYDMLICDNSARVSGFGDAGGFSAYLVEGYLLAAWKYKDGRYLWWWDNHGGGPRRWWVPEDVIARVRPDDIVGLKAAPLAEWIYRWQAGRRAPTFPIGECFDKVSFRGGLETDDQYVCISGHGYGFHAHPDANCIVKYSDKGQVRLYDDGYMIPTLSEHNTVTILKNGWAQDPPGLSQVTANADFENVGIFESRLGNYNGVDWDRAVIWPKGRWFLVIDDLRCIDPAEYGFQCIWRAMGNARLDGSHWRAVKEDGEFNLHVAAGVSLSEREAAGLTLNSPPFPMTEARALVEAAAVPMEAGDCFKFGNLFYTREIADDIDAGEVEVYRAGESSTYFVSDHGQPIAAGVNRGTEIPGMVIEATAFHVTSTDIVAAGATRIRYRGPLLKADVPVDVHIDLGLGKAQVVCPEACTVTYESNEGEEVSVLDEGSHELDIKGLSRFAMRELDLAMRAEVDKYRKLAAGAAVKPAPGSGEKLRKLWEYTDFRAYNNFALEPGVSISSEGTLMTPEEAGYSVGTTKDLLRPNGNVMFRDGETVTLTIDLGRQRDLRQVLVLSRQLVSFNGGCGVSKLTVTVSDDGFANDVRDFGELSNAEKLQDAAISYAVEAEAPQAARYVRIVATPYTETHNVYIDSIGLNGLADKSQLAATGFHLNALEVADIDGDGTHEVFTGGTDKAIHGIGSDGTGLWRYDVPDQLNDIAAVNNTGQGDYQFVGACENHRLYSVNADGTERFTIMPPPRTYERPGYRGVNPFTSRLTVAFGTDIENDGRAEIVIGSANWRTYVFDINGELVWDEVCWAHTPTCGDAFDLDGDGKREVVMGNSYTAAVVYSADGKVIGSGGGSGHAGPLDLTCADLDGNGKGEIIVGDRAGIITFQEWQGRTMPTYSTGMDVVSVATGDLEADGRLETSAASRNYMLYMFDADGKSLWSRNLLSACRDVIIADVMGDAAAEVVCACEDGQVKVLDAKGNVVGWFQGAGWMRNVAACELDGNPATKELAVTCDDGSVYGLQVVE